MIQQLISDNRVKVISFCTAMISEKKLAVVQNLCLILRDHNEDRTGGFPQKLIPKHTTYNHRSLLSLSDDVWETEASVCC